MAPTVLVERNYTGKICDRLWENEAFYAENENVVFKSTLKCTASCHPIS